MHRLRFENARDGSPAPIVDDANIHSAYRPRDEGEKLAQRFIEQHADASRIVVFGLCFGYHILPLLHQFDQITVYEPLPEMLDAARKHPHTQLIFDKCCVTSDIGDLPQGDLPIYALPSYRRVLPMEYTAFEDALAHGVKAPPSIDLSELRVMVDYPVYGGSHTTARYVENAFRKLGCQVRGFDNAYADGLLQRIIAIPDQQRSGDMAHRLTEMLSELLWEEFNTFKPHLVVFLAQAPVSMELLKTIREKSDAHTAMWFVEDYQRFGYWRAYAPLFDAFFGIQQDDFAKEIARHGAKRFGYLPMAADDSLHRRLDLPRAERERYACDVAFMGAGYPNRHALFSQLTDYDLKLWGVDWEGNDRLAPHVQNNGQRVSPEETVKIYNTARININLHSNMTAELLQPGGDFVNPRTFEIMACGGFQLCDRRSLLPELFTEDEDIVCFGSLEELRAKIDHYLAHPDERERIARNGQRKTLNLHTYAHRMRALVDNMAQWYPDWANKLGDTSRHRDDKLSAIGDAALQRFVASRPPAERDNLTALAGAVKEHTGPLEEYESLLLALETFQTNE